MLHINTQFNNRTRQTSTLTEVRTDLQQAYIYIYTFDYTPNVLLILAAEWILTIFVVIEVSCNV